MATTPADIAADPNTITDPTGGAHNFNILDAFESFGYYPTQAEIDALAPSFEGRTNTDQIGMSAIGQYVNYTNQMATFAKNDPLTALQTQMKNLETQNAQSVAGLQTQLQDTLTAAPKLFGSLTADQISTYLQPLQTSFQSQLSQVQATMASRGVAGSSTENNALAQTDQQFQQNVLSTGLNIGLTSQQNQANALQTQINNLFQQSNTAMGIQGSAAGQQSSQDLSQSNLLASLPSFLNANSASQTAAAEAYDKSNGGFQNTFNQVTGDINTGINTLGNLMTLGKNISTPLGSISNSQPASGAGTNPMSPSSASTSMGGTNYTNPNLNAPGYNEFLSSGSSFGS